MMNGKQVPRKVKFWGLAVKYYLNVANVPSGNEFEWKVFKNCVFIFT